LDLQQYIYDTAESLEDTILITHIHMYNPELFGSKFFYRSEIGYDKLNHLLRLHQFQKNYGTLIICGNNDEVEFNWHSWLSDYRQFWNGNFELPKKNKWGGLFYSINIITKL